MFGNEITFTNDAVYDDNFDISDELREMMKDLPDGYMGDGFCVWDMANSQEEAEEIVRWYRTYSTPYGAGKIHRDF